MITAKVLSGPFKGKTLEVDGLANRGDWFSETWLVGIGMGFDMIRIVVEGDNESDVIDALTDSKYGHLIKTDELCSACQGEDWNNCECSYAGNASDRVNLDDIRVLDRCKVNYFAKKDSLG